MTILIHFFSAYLTGKKQYMPFRGFRSDIFDVQSGVSQCSNIGLCLFYILINGIDKCINNCRQFESSYVNKEADAIGKQKQTCKGLTNGANKTRWNSILINALY